MRGEIRTPLNVIDPLRNESGVETVNNNEQQVGIPLRNASIFVTVTWHPPARIWFSKLSLLRCHRAVAAHPADSCQPSLTLSFCCRRFTLLLHVQTTHSWYCMLSNSSTVHATFWLNDTQCPSMPNPTFFCLVVTLIICETPPITPEVHRLL